MLNITGGNPPPIVCAPALPRHAPSIFMVVPFAIPLRELQQGTAPPRRIRTNSTCRMLYCNVSECDHWIVLKQACRGCYRPNQVRRATQPVSATCPDTCCCCRVVSLQICGVIIVAPMP